MRFEACHGLKGPVADVTVVTFTLVHGLDVQLEAVLQGVGCATLLAAEEGERIRLYYNQIKNR